LGCRTNRAISTTRVLAILSLRTRPVKTRLGIILISLYLLKSRLVFVYFTLAGVVVLRCFQGGQFPLSLDGLDPSNQFSVSRDFGRHF
jgi:hypothetical protein